MGPATKRSHQPFAEYDGTISTPADQQYQAKDPWSIMVDRCSSTPKIAVIGGVFPGYYCGSTEWYSIETTWPFYVKGDEPSLKGNALHLSGTRPIGEAGAVAYDMTGTVTGQLVIPKRGPGKGTSEITGTVTPEACPSESFSYTVKFRRTFGELTRGGAR